MRGYLRDQCDAEVPKHREANFLHHQVPREAVGRLHNNRASPVARDARQSRREARARLRRCSRGVLNTHYWIDMKKDVAAVIITQSLPFVEPRFMQAYADYERAVYAM
jgi:hypothetical protein